MGIQSFQRFYGVDLTAIALALDAKFERSVSYRGKLDFSEEDIDEMERLYRSGLGTARIAQRFGCLMGSVWRRLKDRGGIIERGRPLPAEIHLHSHGYLMTRGQYVHRLVAEEMLGRPLRPGECVHHKNGDKKDNRPENLEVHESNSSHQKHHGKERSIWTEAQDQQLLALIAANHSTALIAQGFGRTRTAVQNRITRLKGRGVTIPGRRAGRKGNKDHEAA